MIGDCYRIENYQHLVKTIENIMGAPPPHKHPDIEPRNAIINHEGVCLHIVERGVLICLRYVMSSICYGWWLMELLGCNGDQNDTAPRPPEKLAVWANKSVTNNFPIPEAYWPEVVRQDPETGNLINWVRYHQGWDNPYRPAD